MSGEIYILSNHSGIVPQRIKESESIDIEVLTNTFQKNGYIVNSMTYGEFVNGPYHDIDGSYFYYASSQYEIYKNYISDIILSIEKRGGILIPEKTLFYAHENKSLQEMEKRRLSIPSPDSLVIGTYEEALEALKSMEYPFIAKTDRGFGSRGVEMIESEKDAVSFVNKHMYRGSRFDIDFLLYIYRSIKYRGRYPKKIGKIIFQKMVENYEYDWKILVFDNICFCLKRYAKKGDFRASGSGLFTFEESPSHRVLNFALECRKKLDTPFVSLDIMEDGEDCLLIEYQALHFGLTTALMSDRHYIYDGRSWMEKRDKIDIDELFAKSMINYIEERFS